ncbi:TPT-domain-containing protein [Sparassis crispa]|uniref:TPT-domain-containing protein n=1 Tax=Sparassis crispa TaxID=139825 RepID=A0A401GN12_9APHY|nr:TPT-domain-containing protein [Sparassis crispa]GBE83559.1 TPT-domain-containing protein [Sparassis crispa]
MQPPYFHDKSPVMLSVSVPRSGRSEPSNFGHSGFREAREAYGLFHPSILPEFNSSSWQASRIREDTSAFHLVNHDGLSPLLVATPDANNGVHQEGVRWTSQPRFQPHPVSSPRQRTGFVRGSSSLGVTEPAVLSPLLSEGFPSPSLPVLSPQASKRLTATRKQKRSTIARAKSTVFDYQASWLALYFAFNLGLTLYNKLVLVRFPFPYTLTALHAFAGSVGGWVLMHRGTYVPARLSFQGHLALAVFSVLFAVNIAVSNISLELVTVPFHQVVRAATPIFTTGLSILLFGTQFSRMKILTLVPVMAGVALATYGDYYFTLWGFCLTLLGTFLAALKTIYTNVVQSTPMKPSPPSVPVPFLQFLLPPRLRLHSLDLLTRMAPLACAECVFAAYLTGELSGARQCIARDGAKGLSILLGNACIAFGLNVVSLSANKRVGALNMTVAANIKQVLTILCAVLIFNLTITATNATGILITLVGGAWYAWVEYEEKAQRSGGKRVLTQAGS